MLNDEEVGYPFVMRRMFTVWRTRWLDRVQLVVNQVTTKLGKVAAESQGKYLDAWSQVVLRRHRIKAFVLKGRIAARLLKRVVAEWKTAYVAASVQRLRHNGIRRYIDMRQPLLEQSV